MKEKLALAKTTFENVKTGLAGARKVQKASSELHTNFTTLKNYTVTALDGYTRVGAAVNQLQNGADTLNHGLFTAAAGASQLDSGISQLEAGSQTLSTELSTGASQLQMQPLSNQTASQLSAPLTAKESERGSVPNYGHALAPYVLSLALFVGSIVFNTLYPVRKLFKSPRGGWQWWLAKFSIASAFALLQSLVIGLLSIAILGLQPEHLGHFYLALMVTGLSYMSIVMMLSMLLDNVGRFIALILLVVQLGGSGGTFPIELSNGFFQAVNPYLPMTHSVNALREAISAGLTNGSYWNNLLFMIGVLIFVNIILMVSLKLRHNRLFAHDTVTE